MAVHFVRFRGDNYNRAQRVFGKPDFVHHDWDRRAVGDIAPGDIVVFASGDDSQPFNPYTRDDSQYF